MSVHEEFKLSEYEDTIREIIESGGEFRIYPKGTSMRPLIRQGRDSVALVKAQLPLKKGTIAFYKRKDGQFVLHRVHKADDGTYTMIGDGQIALEKGVTDDRIIAEAGTVYRDDKPVGTVAYSLYLLLWRSFLIRRIYLKIRKLFRRY